MSDLPARPQSRVTRWAIYGVMYFWIAAHHPIVSSLAVLTVAWILATAKMDLQYVVGAGIIVFARKLSQKKIQPQVTVTDKVFGKTSELLARLGARDIPTKHKDIAP